MSQTSSIHSAIATARRRIRIQRGLEAFALALIPASALFVLSVVGTRAAWIDSTTGLSLIGLSALAPLAFALWSGLRPVNFHLAATLVDRHSGLSGRLANAYSFEKKLGQTNAKFSRDERGMMELAIADAAHHAHKARPKEATPFRWPRDSKVAAGFVFVALLTAGIRMDGEVKGPEIARLTPPLVASGAKASVEGTRLTSPSGPTETQLLLHRGDTATRLQVLQLSRDSLLFRVPEDTEPGLYEVSALVAGRSSDRLALEVMSPIDPRNRPDEIMELDEDDLDYISELVAELKESAEASEDQALEELAAELEKLVSEAKEGKLSKKELLEAMNKAEDRYMEGSAEALEESIEDLKEAGKELSKEEFTKELGKALKSGDLDAAKEEFQKLAEQIEKGEMSAADEKKLAETLDKTAERIQKAESQRDDKRNKDIAKLREEKRRLEREQKEAKTERQREELARRLERKKRELRRLERKKEEEKQSLSKRELKELRRDMKKAAQQLQKPKNKQERQKSRREVTKTMRDMARRTGKVSQDQRKMANRPKVSSQLSDLKEAMRRAKRKGQKGPNNKFGKKGRRRQDFRKRAQGGKGQKGAWKPGQGQNGKTGHGKNGQGQGKKGQGQQPGGDSAGDGHDSDLLGDPTKMSGNTVDESLQGVRGKGPSTRETILTSAQKGFSTRSYQDVFARYKPALEEVLKLDEVPSAYKYFVKRYFHQIRPQVDEP